MRTYNERDSVTSRHRITQGSLTYRYNQWDSKLELLIAVCKICLTSKLMLITFFFNLSWKKKKKKKTEQKTKTKKKQIRFFICSNIYEHYFLLGIAYTNIEKTVQNYLNKHKKYVFQRKKSTLQQLPTKIFPIFFLWEFRRVSIRSVKINEPEGFYKWAKLISKAIVSTFSWLMASELMI